MLFGLSGTGWPELKSRANWFGCKTVVRRCNRASTERSGLQLIGVGISLVMLTATGNNVYAGLRLAALQAKVQADSSRLELALLQQFVLWKDEVLAVRSSHARSSVRKFGESKHGLQYTWPSCHRAR